MQNVEIQKARSARGRGLPSNRCVCFRPYCIVFCTACGYWTKGRVRHSCPLHPQTIFLFDINQCPKCKSHEFMLSEI